MDNSSQNVKMNICFGCMKPLEDGQFICQACGHNNSQRNNPEDALPEGSILNGKYLVGKVLGRGGFGVTYLGFELNLQIRVAIKEFFPMGMSSRSSKNYSVISSATAENEAFSKGCAAFLDEARTLAVINSSYVVHVRDYFKEHSTAYLIMDFVDGKTLAREMKETGGRIHPDRLFSLINPMILEIEKLHKKNIIHRDIAPDNLIIVQDELTGEEHLVLLDFGAARSFVSSQISQRYTATVKAGFAPLEQYSQKSKQGPYTDVYALCATIYYTLTGVIPPSALERSADGAVITPLKSFDIDIPDYVENAIMHGLVQSSENRTQTMHQLYEELTTPPDERQIRYNEAQKMMDEASTKEDFYRAEKAFAEIGDYKNALKLSMECREKGEECRKRELYAEAKELMAKNTLSAYKDALKKLESIGTWQDADQQLDYCRLKIKELSGGDKPKVKIVPILLSALVAVGAIAFAILRKPGPAGETDNALVDDLQKQVTSLTTERDEAVRRAEEQEEARLAAEKALDAANVALEAAQGEADQAKEEADRAKSEAEKMKASQEEAEAAAKAKEEEAAKANAEAEAAKKAAEEARAEAEAAEKKAADTEKTAGASAKEAEEALKEARAAAEAAEKKAAEAESEAKARAEEADKAKEQADAATKSADSAKAEAEAAERRAAEATEAKNAAEQRALEATEAKEAAEQRANEATKEKEDLEAREQQRINEEYQKAVDLYNSGSYETAKAAFAELEDYLDSSSYIEKCDKAIEEERVKRLRAQIPAIKSVELDEDNNPVISWDPLEGVDYYTIYRSEDENAYTNLNINTESTSYTLRSCKEGKEYFFKIKAKLNDGTYTDFSEAVSVQIPQRKATAPTIINIELDEDNKPVISWTAVENGDYYTIYWSENGETYLSYGFSTRSTSITVNSCKEGKQYFFKVKARLKDLTYTDFSEAVSIQIPQSATEEASQTADELTNNRSGVYSEGIAFLQNNQYLNAEEVFESLGDYEDSQEKLAEVRYHIGEWYETGTNVSKNERVALSYYQLAADGGNADACNKLGECAYYGIGRNRDYKAAYELFEKASDLGSVTAYYNIGLCYENGNGTGKNERLAISYYQLAADEGSAEALNKLGECAYSGIGRSQNYEAAFALFEQAADLGNVDAFYNIAQCYETGNGTVKNEKTAMAYYMLAADEGHEGALKKIEG